MKVTLINPNLLALKADLMTTGIVYMPVGLAVLAAAVRAEGFEINLIDAFGENPKKIRSDGKFIWFGLDRKQVIDRIQPGTQLIGIYALNLINHESLISIISEIKRIKNDIPVVVIENAQAVTAYSLAAKAETFYAAGADFIIIGDPEKGLCALLDRLGTDQVKDVAGLGWPGGGNAPDFNIDMDSLPYPAWDLFPLENYWSLRYAHGPVSASRYLPLQTSRGCPYGCRFCVTPATSMRKWRAQSPSRVVDEMIWAEKKWGVEEFHWEDLNPTVSDERIKNICRLILEKNLRVKWKLVSGTKVETIKNEETVQLMADAGCRYISISPETGSSDVLRLMGKEFDIDHAKFIAECAHDNGISLQCCFILGFPGETQADRILTRNLVKDLTRCGVDEIALFIMTPVPGSEEYKKLEDNQLSLSELNFSPTWRKDYKELAAFRSMLYRRFIIAKLIHSPFRIMKQCINFIRRRFDTKMEMVPYRALRYYIASLTAPKD